MGLFDKGVQRRGKGLFSNSDEFDTDSVNRSIENARTRITDAGFDPGDADQRNWFEKATNLPENQNFFFDALELIGRPGAGAVNAINANLHGKSTLEGFAKGFSGKERTRGADLAETMGVENKVGKFLVGTTLDIGLDPLTYVPGGVLAKGAKGLVKGATFPVRAGYNALESAAPKLKQIREEVVQPGFERVRDSLGYMFKPMYKAEETLTGETDDTLKTLARQTENSRQYMQEEALSRVSDAARKAGGIDTGEQVGRVVEAPLRQFEEVEAYEFPDGLRITENKSDLQDAINRSRERIKEVGKEARTMGGEYNQAVSELADGLNRTESQIRRIFYKLERQAGKEVDKETRANLREAARELSRINSQLDNFGNNEASMLRYYKKLIRDSHESQFDLVKRIRQSAKSGISGISREDLPDYLKPLWRKQGGMDFGKVAQELGMDERELLDEVARLNGVSRRLDNATLESMARREMERSGATKSLGETRKQLEQARDVIQQSVKAPVVNAATEAESRAFKAIAENPQYAALEEQRQALKKQLEAVRNESKLSKEEKVKAIKELENDIASIQEAMRNPVMIQKEIPRPQREMPTDPRILQAAKTITESNAAIRQFAEENGIDIKELEGYMTHVWSAEERKLRERTKAKAVDRGSYNAGNPNKSILNNRKLTGSAEDVNEQVGRKFFEPNAFFASAIGQKRLIDYIHAVKLRREVLSNPNFAIKYEKGMNVPQNAVVIDSNNYKFIREGNDILENMGLADEIGGQYVVTKAAKELLDRYQAINTDEGSKAFLKAFDAVQSFWKRAALFSVGYHVRNAAGAMFNNYVGGMNPGDLLKYTKEATEEVTKALKGNESDLFNEYRRQGLASSNLSAVEFARFGEEPEKAVERTVKKMSLDTKGKIKEGLKPQNLFESSRSVGDTIDQVNRFAVYKWARDKGMSPEEAAAKVRETQFDYTDLTQFEKKVRRVIPFYAWMRNNIPFQIRQFIADPRKYEYVNKVRLNAQSAAGVEDENVPDYMKEQFAFPVYSDGQGKGKMLGLNLPVGDLTKLSSPLKMAVDSVTPLAKLPAELALNRNFFFNKPIEKFEGQEKQFIGGAGIPIKTAYALEQMTGQIGRGLSGYLSKPTETDQDTKYRMPTFGISSMLKDFDAEKANYFELRTKLKELQDYINYIEQQTGQRPREVREIQR